MALVPAEMAFLPAIDGLISVFQPIHYALGRSYMLCYFALPLRKTKDGPRNIKFMLELEEVLGGRVAALTPSTLDFL